MPRAGLDADAVVAAAANLADAAGIDGLTLAALADRLGIRTPSLYAHINGLPDLRHRLRDRAARQLARELVTAAAGQSRRDALRAIAITYRAYAHAHPGLYAALQQAPDVRAGEDAAAAGELIGVIVAALSGYRLVGDDAIHAVRIVRSALHGFVSLEQLGGFAIELSLDESYDRLVAILDRGLVTLGANARAR